MAIPKAFYAYPSHRPDLLQDIRESVEEINRGHSIKITTWEDYEISGKFIIKNILKAIEQCDLFMCDLTYLNPNVLYELGYAIAKEKKIWITLNTAHRDSVKNYKMLRAITTIGYNGYENSDELVKKFYHDSPYRTLTKIDLRPEHAEINSNLIYMKCEINTNESSKIDSIINKSRLPKKMDDPYEGREPLSWYLNLLPNALGTVIHFHNKDTQEDKPLITARKSLIAGLSVGLGKKTILLAHDQFKSPLDFEDVLKTHRNTEECESLFKEWFEPIVNKFNEKSSDHSEFKQEKKALGKLSNLLIGDHVAENENHDLVEYFLETAEYKEALSAQQVLFVGRKGTGKTANLIKIRSEMREDKRNFVVSIQPQGHEFEGVLKIISNLKKGSEQGHLIESVWKFLIYTEIGRQFFEYLDNLPLHYQRTEEEDNFIGFVKTQERIINADFTLRLENVVNNLSSLSAEESMEENRLRVSEYLHETMIKELRNHLGMVLENKEKVTILIDNLDKGWNDSAELESMSQLLSGLLNVVHKVTDEFHKSSYKHVKVNLSLIVFLRSDIYSRLMSFVDERDKVPYKNLSWNEPIMLFRIIENRIDYSNNGVTSPEALWKEYFCENVNGIPLKNFISNLIIPRPRDIIFFFKSALQEAVNKGHATVEEEDFLAAEYAYSEYALSSLFPENGNRVEDLESIFYEFVGEQPILSEERLIECLQNCTSQNIDEVIKILCELTFLGKETQKDIFEYYGGKRPPKIIDKLSDKLAQRNKKSKRYRINPAFYAYLGIEPIETFDQIV
ncbi:P-loop ATPase, Sll1717 family [Bacillus amyloliquefaciens]